MAFAAYTSALLVAAVFAWAALQYSTAAGITQLAVALSGNGIGGFALVLGILRDDRAQKERERAEKAEQEVVKARQQIEQYRQRAELAEAELELLRSDIAVRVFRLETAAGLTQPDASDDATEI